MSKCEGMVSRIQAEASAEINTIARLKAELHEISTKQISPDSIILRATASILADFYNGVERTMKIILTELDGGLPRGDDWHRQLLANAKIATSMRPPIISEQLCNDLIPYLGFSHVVRTAYGFELDIERVNALAVRVPSVIDDFQKEIAIFLDKIPELI